MDKLVESRTKIEPAVTWDAENNQLVFSEAVMETLRQNHEMVERAKVYEDTFRTELKELMELHGVDSLNTELFDAKIVAPTTRNSFDAKAFKAKYPDMHKEFTKASPVKGSIRITYND